MHLERRFFREFSGNTVTASGAWAATLFRKANNGADNSGRIIRNNTFYGITTRLISESAGTGGSKNVICGNVAQSTADGMFVLYGSAYVVSHNVNLGTGFTANVTCSNSWLTSNSPIATQFGSPTGNVIQ